MSYELAEKYLDQADSLLDTKENYEELLAAIQGAENEGGEDVFIICRSAKILYRYGLLHSNGQFFLLALDRLNLIEEKYPQFLENASIWWQLWGNILIELGKLIDDPSFFEIALQKYQFADLVAKKLGHLHTCELYWDWGNAWAILGQKSGEPTDFKQALAKFYQVTTHDVASIFFHLDYGLAFLNYGHLIGDVTLIQEAISLFRKVLNETSYSKSHSMAYIAAWRQLALAYKIRFTLTHQLSHLEEANSILRDAILSHPRNGSLWLDWGELYLHAGWIRKDVKLIQLGLEKLTASKIKECDPFRVSALLGKGLILSGLFLENFKPIKEGRDRIAKALEVDPENKYLTSAWKFACLASALHVADLATYKKMISLFKNKNHERNQSVEHWHALFQLYTAQGLQLEDNQPIKKGLKAIAHLCTLRPYSIVHWNEWGVTLLRLKQYEPNKNKQITYLECAVDIFAKAAQLGEDAQTFHNWGCALDLLGELRGDPEDYRMAILLLTKALEKNPGQLTIRYHLGLAYSHLGELCSHIESLQEAICLLESITTIDRDDDNIWADLGYAQLNLAFLIEENSLYQSHAEKSLIYAARLGNESVYYPLACLYCLAQRFDLSMRYLIKAKKANTLPPRANLERDKWLLPLRKTQLFQEFILTLGEEDEKR